MRPATALLSTLGTVVVLSPLATAKEPTADDCVKYWGETALSYPGHNHLVHIANACEASADCTVTTDVNPEPTHVTVGGKSEVVVNTFLGSPARVFTPKVKCTMQGST
jgi:hypothetical protein